MRQGRFVKGWIGLLSGLLVLNALAETLPPPEKKEYASSEILDEQFALAGKIIKVRFNRIYYASRQADGLYAGNLRSRVTPADGYYADPEGIPLRFPRDGFGSLSRFFPRPGVSYDEEASRIYATDSGTLYVQVSKDARPRFMAVGDQYRRDGDAGEYRWSVKTELPNLSDRHTVSVSDIWLFPEQLDGRIVELQFQRMGQITQIATNEYRVSVSGGRGCASVPLKVPPAGRAFFKEVELRQRDQEGSYSDNRVYVSVTLTANGTTELEAQGRRISGSGENAEYRW